MKQVSILVLLEVPLRLVELENETVALSWFQSLFCWKFLLGSGAASVLSNWKTSFNPCFAGSSS